MSSIPEDRVRAREEAAAEVSLHKRAADEVAACRLEDAESITEVAEIRATALGVESYRRPNTAPYVITPGDGKYADRDFFATTLGELIRTIRVVVETESPVHRFDVLTRVAGVWSLRLGSRIQARIVHACDSSEGGGVIKGRGDFY